MLCPSLLESPPPSVTLTRLGPRRSHYTVTFSVADSKLLASTKSVLLRHTRQQLYYAGLIGQRPGLNSAREGAHMHSGIIPARQVLGEIALFDCLSPAQLDELALRVHTHLLERGELLFSQGSADCTLYMIASGILEVTKSSDSAGTMTLGRLGAGEYVGEIGLLTGAPHAATAHARTHCSIYQLSREALEPLLAANVKMAATFDKSARRGLALLHRNVAVRATEDVGGGDELLPRILAFFGSRRSE